MKFKVLASIGVLLVAAAPVNGESSDGTCVDYLQELVAELVEGYIPTVDPNRCLGAGDPRICVGVTSRSILRADDVGTTRYDRDSVEFAHSAPIAGGLLSTTLGYSSLVPMVGDPPEPDDSYWRSAISLGTLAEYATDGTGAPRNWVDFVFAYSGAFGADCPTTSLGGAL